MDATASRVSTRPLAELTEAPPAIRRVDPGPRRSERALAALAAERWTIGVYVASRALLLLVAAVNVPLQHWNVARQLSNWDGFWYVSLATSGYPRYVAHIQTTLGFFPLYPMLMWLVGHVLFCGALVAGLLISGFGGLVSTVLVARFARQWWGPEHVRRVVAFFCFFPGSVVFSMDYSEGILIPLAAGALWALSRKRWLLAGVLAGLATAVGPDALAIVPVCAIASALELRRLGWSSRDARRSLFAPALAPVGILSFGAFLWWWAGSPFASFIAQRDGWGERTDWLALERQASTLVSEISFTHFNYHAINLNLVVGLAGTVVLVVGLLLLIRHRGTVPLDARVWSYGIAVLTVTSEYVPPNPRLLITGFPLLMVIAHRVSKRGFTWLLGASVVLLVVMSAITFVGIALRP